MSDAATLWLEYEPKLKAARDKDRHEQQGIFVRVPTDLGGVWIEPLSIEGFLLLEGLDHPLIAGGEMTSDDLFHFLWITSHEFKLGDREAAARYFKKLEKLDLEKIQENLGQWFQEQFSSDESDSPPHDWVVTMIDIMASEYGWHESEILELPLRRAFAYCRAITQRKSQNQIKFARHADKVKADYMAAVQKLKPKPETDGK